MLTIITGLKYDYDFITLIKSKKNKIRYFNTNIYM